jgi:hypothetical protein
MDVGSPQMGMARRPMGGSTDGSVLYAAENRAFARRVAWIFPWRLANAQVAEVSRAVMGCLTIFLYFEADLESVFE